MQVLWWIVAALGAILVFGVLPLMIMGHVLYSALLTRKPGEWGRSCPNPDDAEYKRMFDEGDVWGETYRDCRTDVTVESDGLRLAGEFYDFGSDSAVILIPGRTETVLYSRFFAEPYRKAGLSVLLIDNRAHGLSEGKRSSLGAREYRDIQAWVRLLAERFSIRKVLLHGICIGAATAIYAAADPECPPEVCGIVAEGVYTTFFESFKNNMRDRGHNPALLAPAVAANVWLFSGANIVTDGPLRRIRKLKVPVLFLHSREDRSSRPEKSVLVMEKCPSEKTVVWFERGAHSRIRCVDPDGFDEAVTAFACRFSPAGAAKRG